MKPITILFSISVLAAACGGKSSESTTPKEPEPEPEAVAEPKAAPEEEAEAEPEPPPPKTWSAHAELAPSKGVKYGKATVTFKQTEGEATNVGSSAWFNGLKAGKYHLVVHEAAACGANGSKAGKAGASIEFTAAKGQDSLEVEGASVELDGDATIIGRTLALHDDKKGKPGKILACGPIAAPDGDSDDEDEEK